MRVALFRSSSLFAAWSVSQGITEVLRQMGHEAVDCPIDPTKLQMSRGKYPTLEQLNECDGILVSGPEHLGNHLRALYPDWDTVKTPKAGWMHETVEHPTYRIVPDDLKKLCDVVFCPGAQDEKHGFKYLPFGVDVNVFKPAPTEKLYDAAFIGSLYPKRQQFLAQLKPHLKGIDLKVGMVGVQDLSGDCQRATAELLAENLRRIKIFVNLPAMSGHTVTKVTECCACGTAILTPNVGADSSRQLLGAAYVNAETCSALIRQLLGDDELRENYAKKHCREVHEHHRLDQRLTEILKAFA